MPAESPLGRMIERGYARGGAMDLRQIVEEIQGMAGYSDRAAAKLVKVHHRTWQRWRKGEATPNILHLMALDEAVRKVRADSRPFRADQLVIKTRGHDDRKRTIHGHQLGFNLRHEAAIERSEERRVGKEGRSGGLKNWQIRITQWNSFGSWGCRARAIIGASA